jgi:hypothetical protein
LSDLNGEALAREEIDHRQRAEPTTIGQLIGDEVHAPDVVARDRWTSSLTVDRRRMTPRALPSQGQAFLRIEPIKALFTDLPAFAQQQDPQPTVSKANPGLRELAHALPQGRQRILAASVVHGRTRRAHHQAGAPGTDRVAAHQVLHDLTLLDGL